MRILDVGCGAGADLISLSHLGFKNILGIDPYISEDIVYNTSLSIKKIGLDELGGEWDVIMFNHSLEHISDQNETFKNISRLLAKTGTCMLRIPTASSWAWKHYKENWIQIDAPRHLYLHSLKSIGVLASKAGLAIGTYYYDSTDYQLWASEQIVKGIPLKSSESYKISAIKYDLKRSIFTREIIENYKKKAEELNKNNEGDQIVIYLKKA
jgi:2-polyprenyl-3-methyl-5-hydroxy-6-metoxy-1,4-benzoquinol methylase